MPKRYPASSNAWSPLLDAFIFDCQVRNLTPKTVSVYRERLGYFFTWLDSQKVNVGEVTKQTIQDYIMALKGRVSDETINGRIRSIKRFYNFVESEELAESNPGAAVRQLRTPHTIKPVVTPDDVQAIISGMKRDRFECNRDLLMVLLFWDCMLRRNEVIHIKLSDIDLQSRLLKVHGKGRKDRLVPLGLKTLKVLQHYLNRHRKPFPGDYLVCMRNGEAMTEQRCYRIIHNLGRKHGLKLYPHLLRHSAATWYIRQGGNPAVLQGIMGHTSLLVTQNYLHLSSQDAVNSYAQFSPSNCLKV